MKVKYIGETFYNGLGLTNGKIYECLGIDYDLNSLIIIDDEEEETLYSIINPKPIDKSSKGGKWEIIEDNNGQLRKKFEELKLQKTN